jgi:hypothetical protein
MRERGYVPGGLRQRLVQRCSERPSVCVCVCACVCVCLCVCVHVYFLLCGK